MKHKVYKKEYFEQVMEWFGVSTKNIKKEDKSKNEEEKENAKRNKI